MPDATLGWKEQAPLLPSRLLELKKDVRDLQDALENVIVNAPSDEEHKQWQLEKHSMPEQLRYLTEHPLIHLATKVKSQDSAAQVAQLLGAEVPDGVLSPSTTSTTESTVPVDARHIPPVISVGKSNSRTLEPLHTRIDSASAQRPVQPDIDSRKRSRTEEAQGHDASKKPATGLPLLPEITDNNIRDLVFTHRTAAAANAINSGKYGNDHLAFVGHSLLHLCTSLMVTTYYPEKDAAFLEVCRSRVIPATDIYNWCLDYGLDKQLIRLDTGNEYFDAMVDLFHAYIGGLYQEDRCQLTRTKAWIDALIAPLVASYDESEHASRPQTKVNIGTSSPAAGPARPTFDSYPKGLARGQGQEITLDAMSSLPVEATRPMKERLYLQVSLAFIPQYETYFTDLGAVGRPPCFRVAVLINGDLMGIGEAVNMKEAGSRAAWCAMNLNSDKVERYSSGCQEKSHPKVPSSDNANFGTNSEWVFGRWKCTGHYARLLKRNMMMQ